MREHKTLSSTLGSLGSKVIFPLQPKTHFFGDIVDFVKSCDLCSAAVDFRKAECALMGVVNVSLCEVLFGVAEMHLYAQLPACMESFLKLQRHQELQIPVCCSTLAFFL